MKGGEDLTSEMQRRSTEASFETRSEQDEKYISGYFVVFDSPYDMGYGMSESVDRRAFDEALKSDIRCLIDHDPRLVLGRTKSGTLKLRADEKGLWGEVRINPNDTDAVNLYERVKRGDISQCSFGFDILEQDHEERDGGVHWTIKKVKLYEVSVVAFPAYEETSVEARKAEFATIKKKQLELWKEKAKKTLKGAT